MSSGTKTPDLWSSHDCALWRAALDSYPQVIAAQQNEKLARLDDWYSNTLTALLAERREKEKEPCLYPDELQGVAAWKMIRGVWRERNRLLIEQNAPTSVEQASLKAFAAVPDPAKPISALSALSGVGPATASAVMAAYAPEVYPFFDDLVAAQVPSLGRTAFTMKYYTAYSEALRQRAAELSGEECTDKVWTPQAVSQALWANSGGKIAHPELF